MEPNEEQEIAMIDLDDDEWVLTTADYASLHITRVCGSISLLAAICVLIETWVDIQEGRKHPKTTRRRSSGSASSSGSSTNNTVTRLLFANMIAHSLFDISLVFGILPVPVDAYPQTNLTPGAKGTTGTCEAQGFVSYFGGICLLMYDMSISITYVCMVKYNLPETKLHKFEIVWHCLTLAFAFSYCISALILDAFNYDFGSCAIETYPAIEFTNIIDDDEIFADHEDNEFVRGSSQQVIIFDWIYYSMIILVSVVSITSMALIYCHARSIEKRNRKYYSGKLGLTAAGKYSKEVAIQGVLYSSTFVISNFPATIEQIIFETSSFSESWLYTFVWALACLHSFFYLLFFIRNRDMKTRYGRLWKRILCCCCTTRKKRRCCFKKSGCDSKDQQAVVSHQSVVEEIKMNRNDNIKSLRRTGPKKQSVVTFDVEEGGNNSHTDIIKGRGDPKLTISIISNYDSQDLKENQK